MANETVAESGAASNVRRRTIGHARAVLCLLVLAGAMDANAQTQSCPLAGQNPMLVVQLFFGLSAPHRGPVTAKEWNSFLQQTVTPRFPEGFTVYEAYGQSWNPATRSVGREKTKVILIAIVDTAPARAKIAEVADQYRGAFHQRSVGILTSPSCGAF
jgi:Protein of unknown function (DUF3574)